MTEAEWLAATDPKPMLDHLQPTHPSDRKLRLFVVACLRGMWRFLTDERSRRAVGMNESYADGQTTEHELSLARKSAERACDVAFNRVLAVREVADRTCGSKAAALEEIAKQSEAEYVMNWQAAQLAAQVQASGATQAAMLTEWAAKWHPHGTGATETMSQCDLLRDLFGPLSWRPGVVNPAWRTPPVLSLAQEIYARPDLARFPSLASALEEAGCTSPDILDHCRGPGPHVRGCWLVDLLLDKR
jgi:hypothetical protein